MDMQDKRVLITGSSRGIGLATAEAYLKAGAMVAINGTSIDSVATALEGLAAGESAVAAPGDVSTADGCHAVVNMAADALGGLDILVNNAGVYRIAWIADTAEADWDAVLDVGLKAAFFCTQAAAPALKDSHGSIVNIASAAGLAAYPGVTAYCAAKGGLVHLTKAMAMELAPDVRVNVVCPGPVDTDMGQLNLDLSLGLEEAKRAFAKTVPLDRIADAHEIAETVLWLTSDAASFITGAALAVDGGRTAGGMIGRPGLEM